MKLPAAAAAVLAAAFCAGCGTTAMKGTPFWSGEYAEREGAASDRVNLWPVAYWRDPALSVLWPLGEFAPDRRAVRPFFSEYRDGDSGPWTQFNWLGGLVCFDRATDENVVFPFYWGNKRHYRWDAARGGTSETTNSYFHVFPLWWSSHDPGADRRFNSLFPLWVYSRRGDDTLLFCPWPVVAAFRDPLEHRHVVFPLYDRKRFPRRPDCYDDRFGLVLAGRSFEGGDRLSWLFPLWFSRRDADGGLRTFHSPLWSAKRDDWRAVPLLLSSWKPDGAWGRVLLGIGGWEETSSWAFPLWYQDSATGEILAPLCYRNPRTGVFASPLWASKEGAWRCVPPLLSWWSPGTGSGRALLGLAGWDDTRSWAVPFYYRDAASDTLVTPLWASQAGRWSAVPPLLSWSRSDPATGDRGTYLAGGLVGIERGAEPGRDCDWFAPLYFRDEEKERFLSPLWAHGKEWAAVPPLLSFWRRDGKAGAALLGLGGWSGETKTSWLFPFWLSSGSTFYSLPWSRWTQGGTTYRSFATVLAGWKSGRENGWWALPFGGCTRYADQERWRYNWLMLGGGNVSPSASSHWFFPFVMDRTRPEVDSMRSEMDSPRLSSARTRYVRTNEWTRIVPPASPDAKPGTVVERSVRYENASAESGTSLLLGLAGTSHEVSLDPWRSHGLFEKTLEKDGRFKTFFSPPEADAPGAVARYLAEDGDWFFPLWSHGKRRVAMFRLAGGEKELDAEDENFSLLFFLYDFKRESIPSDGHEYVRRRVLWRLYHHEELDGDSSTDVFPAITWDRRKDGYRKASFLWRLFRWERDPEKGTSLDLLFVPLLRP